MQRSISGWYGVRAAGFGVLALWALSLLFSAPIAGQEQAGFTPDQAARGEELYEQAC